jgi:hypothetical protein
MAQTSTTLNARPRLVAAGDAPSRATLTALCLCIYLTTVFLILTAEALAAKWHLFSPLH